jgi:hypothetical protein
MDGRKTAFFFYELEQLPFGVFYVRLSKSTFLPVLYPICALAFLFPVFCHYPIAALPSPIVRTTGSFPLCLVHGVNSF